MSRPILVPLLVLLAGSVGGCMAEEPTTTQYGTVPDKNLPDFSKVPDMAPAGPVQPPVLSGLPQTSQYTSYPLKGTATPGDTVIISGTAVGDVSAEVDSTGSFCALVQLMPDVLTTMSLVTVDPSGNMSTAITFSVTQSGAPPQQGAGTPSINAALMGTASTTDSFKNGGDESLVHDGDPTTFVEISDREFSSTDSITLALPQAQIIKQIHVRAPSSCALTGTFAVYISNSLPAADSGPGQVGWTLVSPAPVASDSSDTDWVINFTTPPTIQSISLYFDHTLVPSNSAEENCGSYDDSDYQISEIEAWTVAGVAPPPVGSPSCE